jgi:hypothetical protein
VIVILNGKDRAAVQNTDLCKDCRHFHEHVYAHNNRVEKTCHVASEIMRLKGPVAQCNDYFTRTQPYLSEMKDIAWTIERRGTTGFKAEAPEKKL